MYLTGQLIIGANDVAATAGTMKALNPATHEWIEPDFALGDAAHVHQAAKLADEAFDKDATLAMLLIIQYAPNSVAIAPVLPRSSTHPFWLNADEFSSTRCIP